MKIRKPSLLKALFSVVFLSMPSTAQNMLWFGSDVHCHYDHHTADQYRGWYNLNKLLSTVVNNNGADFIGLIGDHIRKVGDAGTTQDRQKDYNDVVNLVSKYYPSTSVTKIFTQVIMIPTTIRLPAL